MANDINVVTLVGRLTRDSELKYTNSGTAVCKFSLAVNRKKRSGDQWTDEVSYFDVVLWGKQGEALQQYLGKGKQVAVSGELRQNRWEQDGQNRSKVEIIANNIQLLGGNTGGGNNNFGGGQSDAPSGRPSNNQSFGSFQPSKNNGPENFEDDIPF
ncbi:MAG: single-stranded DNA-binding protein [Spirochaetia bacterium]|jgi:single-strand DNA-binding protein|nr:single-stranded DNA-binding protein [Spirochaetia bacterium]